jgi:DHA1 family bicyclomycin/chloramphenicol resistance-like MFS transporter
MYLGALPEMATSLHSTPGALQLSVTTFFLGYTVGQLFYGPVSDKTGRKPMIYLAMAIFVIGSIGALLAGSGPQLVAWRFLQGLGGSIGMVIASAVVRDLFTGAAAAKMMSMVVLVIGVAPIVAPLVGSVLLRLSNWQMIFGVLASLGAACLLLVRFALPETRMEELRAVSHPAQTLKWYVHLLRSRHFIPYAGALALAQGSFFAYIAGSSFVFVDLYGLSPLTYSILFSLNAIGLGIGAQIANRLVATRGLQAVARGSSTAFALAGVALLLAGLTGIGGMWSICLLLFLMVTSLGGIMPTCNVLSVEAYGAIAGTAAALTGALGFGAGALASMTLGFIGNGSALPMIAIMAACAIGACLVANFAFPERHATQAGE